MTTLSKAAQREVERGEAIARLREILKPGDTVYTILRHCSKSGMNRVISLVKPDENGRMLNLDRLAAKAGGYKIDDRYDGIKVGGTGMNMGFALVYGLSRTLWRDGHECIGERCPSNDHANGDRDYTPGPEHMHRDGGYALNQSWL